jgi:hypothetical protein
MVERYAAGRDVEHWVRIHDQLNGLAPSQAAVIQSPPDPWLAVIRACPDHNPGCCASPLPYCSRFHIHPSREQCISCLEGQGIYP